MKGNLVGTRTNEVVDALLAVVRAAPDLAGITVYDGPYVTGDVGDSVHIGYDADPEASGEAFSSDEGWAGLGAKKKDETVNIHCSVHVTNGDADTTAARTRAYELFGAVEDAIHRPSPSMGLSPPSWAAVASSRMFYVLTEEVGLEAWLTFTVSVRTRF